MARVVVGLSGGVDSSVTAHLLVEQGHEVIGLFMRNWHDESVTLHDECPWIEDSNDAMLVAEALGIPFQVIDLSAEYKERIVDYMFAEYQAGRTPNPDVLCNREIKFDTFLQKALELGADYVATGHYCQKGETTGADGHSYYQLLAGADPQKDQSYFLCQLTQEQLRHALFPIGHLQKDQVRAIAAEQGLVTAEKRDSQGLCFVGKVRLPDFLQQKLAPRKGPVVEIAPQAELPRVELPQHPPALARQVAPYAFKPELGKVIGEHTGAHYFTVGQRKGLAIGGTAEPLFVLGTDTEANYIYTGQGAQHQALHKEGLFIEADQQHWVRPDHRLAPGQQARFQVRIRYRQPLQPATVYAERQGLYLIFDQAQKAITPGQFAAWYQDQELIGSGVIAF
ncbi:MAG: tRNA 2-thiouridine(34) synthase MnmA [Schleiferiaceae bacterium]|nr:tRNA 2-thiouridine(34) synthase MnmA [Schleiferiaceae bacterium]